MKKVFLFTTAIILLTLVFSSCKKDKAQTTAQKVQHNWNFVSVIDNSHDATGDDITTTNGVSGDFMNFVSNGTISSQFDGEASGGIYTIPNDTEILIDGQTFTIKTLTDTQFVLYIKDVISATDYDEETINLKR
jgi:hypothetical protein